MGNSPRYVGFLDPPYNVMLTDDSGNALNLTGVTSNNFTLTMLNANTGLFQSGVGVWTITSATLGQASYQWTVNDMATAGPWWVYTTVKLPAEPNPREFDPELILILPGTVGAGAAPSGVLPVPPASPLFINVRDYGALGAGADYTTAIQAAINAGQASTYGAAIFIPRGLYLYSTDLVVSGNNIMIFGEGRASQLQAAAGTTNVANGIKVTGANHVVIKDLQINGNKANINQAGAGTSYTTKQGVYVTGGSTDVTVVDCYINNCFAGGVLADNASLLFVIGNRFDACGDNAIFLRPGPVTPWTAPSNATIAGNIVSNGTFSGIGVIKSSFVSVFSNVSYGNGPTAGQGSGIVVEGATNCTVSGNICHDNGVNGIDLRYSNEGNPAQNLPAAHITCAANQCYNNGYGSGFGNAGGIVSEGVDDAVIQGNNCYHNENGINLGAGNGLDPTRVLVQGNECRTNNLIGLRFFTNAAAVDLVANGNYVSDNLSDQFTANCKVLVQGGLIARPSVAGKENIHLLAGASGSIIDGVKMTDPIDNCLLIDTTVTGVIVRNCIFDKAAGTGGRGLYEATTTGAGTYVENCRFMGFTFQSFAFNNPASIARHNDVDQSGLYDHNSGTASIAAGTATLNVTHNLYAAPSRVELTPTADTQGLRWWISAKGATTFTITLSGNAVTNPVTFDWRAWTWDN